MPRNLNENLDEGFQLQRFYARPMSYKALILAFTTSDVKLRCLNKNLLLQSSNTLKSVLLIPVQLAKT